MLEYLRWYHLLAIGIAYVMGSIPTAVWLGKLRYGVDVRDFGSGNAGATNTFRVLGKKAALPVLLIDVAKGFLAVTLLPLLSPYEAGTYPFVDLQIAIGVFAVLGHIFPIFAQFNGGKGVATLLGVILALHLYAALIAFGVFVLTLLITRYVSLGSMLAAVSFPILITLIFKVNSPSLIYFSIIFSIIVLFTHQKNIERLLKRRESRIDFNGHSKED